MQLLLTATIILAKIALALLVVTAMVLTLGNVRMKNSFKACFY